MAVNKEYLILLTVLSIIILYIYYAKILTIDEGENKQFKMFKRILTLVIIVGFIHIYSITEDTNIKPFLIIVFAVALNVYTVIHSTKHCNFPRLFVIRLSLVSAGITVALATVLWYTYSNTLFSFLETEIKSSNDETGVKSFDSISIGEIVDTDARNIMDEMDPCPDKDDDDYNALMHNLNKNDIETYNGCLEKEIRSDLAEQ